MSEAAQLKEIAILRAEDAAARSAALDHQRSFIVQAPAGSGKTELLIQRYLGLLAHVDQPEEIVAITFTLKATAEMRARVLEALAAAEVDTPPEVPHERRTWELARAVRARDAQAGWRVGENPNRLRIQTIDALCHWLTLRLPMRSGFGAQPETIEDARELYEAAAGRVIAALGTSADWSRHVATVLRHLDNHVEIARGLLADMLATRDQWIRSVLQARGRERETLETALANAVRDALANLSASLPTEMRAELIALACHAAENLESGGNTSPISHCRDMSTLPEAGAEDLERWRGLAELLLTQAGAVRRTADARIGFPAASAAKGAERDRRKVMKARFETVLEALGPHRTFIEQLHFTRMLPPAMYADTQWRVVEALVALLPVAAAQLELLFRERGQVDFTAVSQAAVRALGEPGFPTDLALALDCRIRHILVDEFQDTSLSQFDLLERLTAGWEPGDGRSLFVVGDPMQSIYRFRKAEVALFMRAWHEGLGTLPLERLRLTVNFRSTRAIVDWFNRTFDKVLPDAEDMASGAVPFAHSAAAADAPSGVPPQFQPLLTSDRALEARLVADLVARARAEDSGQSIAILVRSRTHLAAIAPALRGAGLGFQAVEIEQLGHRPVVQDLLALTRALVHAADRVAWLAVLRAPWCGLTLADLAALAGDDHEAAMWTLMNDPAVSARLSREGQTRLAHAREAMGAALSRRRREPLRRWVESAWLALGGPACVEDRTDLADAEVFFGLLEELEEGGDLPALERLATRVGALHALPDTDAAAANLQLMTIHKAKGLQFDIVILPGLGHAPRRDDPKLLLWLERPRARAGNELLLAPIREASAESDAVYDYLAKLEQAKERHEAARLLYVAATRAKARLHLIGSASRTQAGGVKPRKHTLLDHLWPVVAPEFGRAIDAEGASPQPQTPDAGDSAVLHRLASGWQPPPVPEGVRWRPRAALASVERSPHDEVEFSWASETAKHVGTVVHRFLQAIGKEGIERWDEKRVGRMRPVFRRDLARLGVPQSEIGPAVARVTQALAANLADARGRWVLSAHAEAETELRLTGVLAGELVNAVIDRTFVDEAGTRWIVDYKTGVHEGADREGFLDREQDRYRGQVERYGALMQQLDGRPLRLALYFPLLKGWREWAY